MNWLRRFMQGRYGVDQLNLTVFGLLFFLYVVHIFTRNSLVILLCYVLLAVYVYRAFSRNIIKRSAENAKFLHAFKPLTEWWKKHQHRMKDKRTHKYYTCPNCKQKIRVPKGKGKICITCPKCRMEFIKKT